MNTRRILPAGAIVGAAFAACGAWAAGPPDEGQVRPAQLAGRWYPGDADALARQIDGWLEQASPTELPGKPYGIISPHAGYRFSGQVAAAGYRTLRGHSYRRVIVLAFSHRYASSYQGVDVPAEVTAYETPLGRVPLDRRACDQLLAHPVYASHPGVDRGEHSLELQLPFLQRVLGDFQLVPLLVGRMEVADYTAAAKVMLPLLDSETLLVASTDFTHFGPNYGYEPFDSGADVPQMIRQLADQAGRQILESDFDGFLQHTRNTKDTICGRGPVSLLLRAQSMQGGATGFLAAYDTSGRITGDWTNSVTYQSFVFTETPLTLSQEAQSRLLRLARQTVTAYLTGQEVPRVKPADVPDALRAKGASFVTLTNHGSLRGCIGNMTATGALYESVVRNAVSACQDRRFVHKPVTAEELDEIEIEISYLTPTKRVADTDDIVVGRHGLLISLGADRGVLLPQVAYERGWTREEFLNQVCAKARLPRDAWKRRDAEVYCFTAEVFGENQ